MVSVGGYFEASKEAVDNTVTSRDIIGEILKPD